MLLFKLLLVFIGNSHLADSSPPKIPFQLLLDTCTNTEYSNSTYCQYFFSTYPWRNDDIQLVFNKVISTTMAHRSSAWNSLRERLIRLIENPYFDLAILGKHSFYTAVTDFNEPLAIAIWPQLEKYKNQTSDFYFYSWDPRFPSSDLQLFECYVSMADILDGNMLQLLKKMATDQPDCLHQNNRTMARTLSIERSRAVREFLVDHGLEIIPMDFQTQYLSSEGFEWALLHYRQSNDLIKNSIINGHEVVATAIWEFLKQMNYKDLLLHMCANTVFDVVKTNKVELVKTMLRYCPNSILSNGDTLMGIAINGGSLPMIHLLNVYGVKIAPNHLHKAQSLGYTGNFDRAILKSDQTKYNLSNIVYDYFKKAAEENYKELCNKILFENIAGTANIVPVCLEWIISFERRQL